MHTKDNHLNFEISCRHNQSNKPSHSNDWIRYTGVFSLYGWVVRWYQRRVLIRELQNLNDHSLKDIGLERSGIESFATQMSRGDIR